MTTPECLPGQAHQWLIDPANGPISQGQCQNCLEVKGFDNSLPEYEGNGWSKMQIARDSRQDGGDFYPQGNRVG